MLINVVRSWSNDQHIQCVINIDQPSNNFDQLWLILINQKCLQWSTICVKMVGHTLTLSGCVTDYKDYGVSKEPQVLLTQWYGITVNAFVWWARLSQESKNDKYPSLHQPSKQCEKGRTSTPIEFVKKRNLFVLMILCPLSIQHNRNHYNIKKSEGYRKEIKRVIPLKPANRPTRLSLIQ